MNCGNCPFWNKGLPLKPDQHSAPCGLAERHEILYRHETDPCRYGKSTLADMWWQEMGGYEIRQNTCCVCGAHYPLNQHHVPPRSAGNIVQGSKKLPKPTLTLCGSGNTSGCHGKAEHRTLHFKFREGKWWYIETPPTDRLTALEMEGWKECYICD